MPKAKARAKARAAAAAAAAAAGGEAAAAYTPDPRGPFGGASVAAFNKLIEYVHRDTYVAKGAKGKIPRQVTRNQQ